MSRASSESRLKQSSTRPLQFCALGILVAIVGLLGGSSRLDLVQVIALNGLAVLVLVPVVYWFNRASFAGFCGLAALLGFFVLWMLLQLLPLPTELWRALPKRESIAALDTIAGLGRVWRPLSMAPTAGWASLIAFIVPAVAFLLAISLKFGSRALLHALLALGVIDALFGLAQMAVGSGALHFYRITNISSPVGLFANENHSAVFSSLCLILAVYLGSEARTKSVPNWRRALYPLAFILFLTTALSTGSRAGVATTFVALAASIPMSISAFALVGPDGRSQKRSKRDELSWYDRWRVPLITFSALCFIALVTGALLLSSGATGFQAFFANDVTAGYRLQIFPTLAQMVSNHWIAGTGIGTFKDAYHIYEMPQSMLPNYVNQAHNDWMQLVIEGGLPALALLAALAVWVGIRIRRMVRSDGWFSNRYMFWLTAIIIMATASVVDYPLRTPIFQLFAVWLFVSLELESRVKRGRK